MKNVMDTMHTWEKELEKTENIWGKREEDTRWQGRGWGVVELGERAGVSGRRHVPHHSPAAHLYRLRHCFVQLHPLAP